MDTTEKERRTNRLVGAVFVLVVLGVTWAVLPVPFVDGIPWVLGIGALCLFVAMLGRRRSDKQPPRAIGILPVVSAAVGGAPRGEGSPGPCPPCPRGERELIARIAREGVPHGAEGHEHVFRTTELFRCKRCGRGQLVHEDHDCFGRYDTDDRWEPWDMDWTHGLDAGDMESLRSALVALCPDPRDPLCRCAAHEGLRSSRLPATGGEIVPVVLRMKDGAPTLESRPAK